MRALTAARAATLLGYTLLVTQILVWHGWLHPPQQFSRLPVLAILLAPLLFPLAGILRGRAYTHAWASLVALIYFVLGVAHVAVASERRYGAVQIGSSLLLFFGCVFYARIKSRASRPPAQT